MDLGHQQLQECQGRDHGEAIHRQQNNFANFPAPSYDNPYANWQPAEPVPWVSEGGEY